MSPVEEHALMLAIVSIGTKVIAMDTDRRLWGTSDQLALCRDVHTLQQCLADREAERTRQQGQNRRRKAARTGPYAIVAGAGR
jgi:hypothetical protein